MGAFLGIFKSHFHLWLGKELFFGIGCVSVHFYKGTVILLRIQKSAFNQKQTFGIALPWLNACSLTTIDSYNFIEKTDTKHSRSWFNLSHFKLVTWQFHSQFDNSITLVNKIVSEWVTDTGPNFLIFVFCIQEIGTNPIVHSVNSNGEKKMRNTNAVLVYVTKRPSCAREWAMTTTCL